MCVFVQARSKTKFHLNFSSIQIFVYVLLLFSVFVRVVSVDPHTSCCREPGACIDVKVKNDL